MPDLSTAEGQAELDELIERWDSKIIFIDNLSTLCRTGKENDSESWNSVQSWAIKHRSQGRSIVFVHYSNKGGGQRGTSKKEIADQLEVGHCWFLLFLMQNVIIPLHLG